MKIVEDILDLVVAIFLIGLTISVSFTVVLPIFNEDKNQVGLVDKTSPEFLGYDLDSSYDGARSYLDVVLATQVQDFNLPEPKQFTIATDNPDMVLIDSTYNSSFNLNEVKNITTALLNREGNTDSRYRVKHNYGLSTNNSTNLAINGNMETNMDFESGLSPWNLGGGGSGDAVVTRVRDIPPSLNYRTVITTPSSDATQGEIKEINLYQNVSTVVPNSKYQVSADVYCENCSAKLIVERLAQDGSVYTDGTISKEVRNTTIATSENLKVEFDVSNNIVNFVVKIEKVNGERNGQPEKMVVDNVEFKVFENSDPYYEFIRVN